MAVVEWFVNGLYAYAAIGLVFAGGFISVGINRVDPVARGSGLAFRLMVLPGSVALWPMLLSRWVRGGNKE